MKQIEFKGYEYQINREHLQLALEQQTTEDIKTMEAKAEAIVGNTFLGSYKDRLLAIDMFKLGYLAAQVNMNSWKRHEEETQG